MWNSKPKERTWESKNINLRFAKRFETLDEIIKFQLSPLIKTGLGYSEETSKIVKSSTKIGSYLNAP